MKICFVVLTILLLFGQSFAFPECVKTTGSYPYRVFENDNNTFLGVSGYSSEELCKKAIATTDLRLACAPVSVPGSFGSAIFHTRTGKVIGYKSSYYTSVNHCSTAIGSSRGNVVCIPGPDGAISIFDFVEGKIIGTPYSTVEYCKQASLSASFTKDDPYICARNSDRVPQIYNRKTGTWIQNARFSDTSKCREYLNARRGVTDPTF